LSNYTFEEICELIRLVAESGVASVEIEHGDERLRVKGVPPVPAAGPATAAAPAATAPASGAPAAASAPATGDPEGVDQASGDDLHYVSSPIVGTFYRAPNPDADPYVRVGDLVKEGQTLCIVEAMKLMNEIECDVAGTVVKVFPDNAHPVEYGERLFAVRPA
jgi:acetyl-CoA carboxylase biotin carboxyl carrier protein